MIHLLICDDEPVISDGMYEVFSRDDRLEVYNVYHATDALDMLEKMRIDIILLDIRMPGINGLEALGRIKRSWPLCQVIMLTGYDDFGYIYEATSYSGVKYVLKSEGFGKIMQVVDEAIEDITNRAGAEKILKEAQEQLRMINGTLKKDFLVNVLKGLVETPATGGYEIEMALEPSRQVGLVIGRPHAVQGEKDRSSVMQNQFLHYLGHIIGTYIASVCSYELVVDAGNIYYFVQPWEPEHNVEARLKGHLEMAQEYCKWTLNATVSFAIEPQPGEWGLLWEKAAQLTMLMNIMADGGDEMFISIAGKHGPNQPEILPDGPGIPQARIDQLAEALHNGREDDFFGIFLELRQSVESVRSIHSMAAQERYLLVALTILNCVNKYGLGIKLAFETSLYKLTKIDAHDSWQDAFDYLEDLSHRIFKLRAEAAKENENEIVRCIKQHIAQHLEEPDKMTLLYISDMLYFNASYLSRLFKQLTGVNLSEYMISCKIELAKSLLLNPDAKISDIAERVGYTSPANFTRIFKKVTGQSPHDYRITHAVSQR